MLMICTQVQCLEEMEASSTLSHTPKTKGDPAPAWLWASHLKSYKGPGLIRNWVFNVTPCPITGLADLTGSLPNSSSTY